MKNKTAFRILFLLALALVATLALRAQTHTTAMNNILRPPAGAKVALIEFADLQCPDCANAGPLLEEASRTYKIPLIVYDFPLPQHPWSNEAAVFAHYLRSVSTKANNLEMKYRLFIYRNQSAITLQNLRTYVDKFAAENKISIPFAVDPQGKFAASVRADKAKGVAINIQHTPTIYVVSAKRTGAPFVEVVNRNNLYAMIDDMLAETKSLPSEPADNTTASKKSGKPTAKND